MPKTDITILKALLQSPSEFVSGNDLAEELGISRVGVWARLEKLREEGFKVEAIRHRGYRLLEEPQGLNERLIHSYLELLGSDKDILFVKEVDSTNSQAEREIATGRKTPFVVMTTRQSAGRGRRGRVWHSEDSGNIMASFAFNPNLPPHTMQTITLWLGLKVCEFINKKYDLKLELKWPNDLLIDGRKVSGMLTEARVDTDRTRDLIFGIGLNVNSAVETWPEEVAKMATSLSQQNGNNLLINKIAAELILVVHEAYETFISRDTRDEMQELWKAYNAMHNRKVETEYRGQPLAGHVEGITNNGAILIRNEKNGILHEINSGEISLGSSVFSAS
jgi:BirA family biotin operon repressor/biotin-[acetyl-CoA-carboxylase] ligase